MNQLSSLAVEFSAKDQQFCDNLLNLAKWLDSQEEYFQVCQSPLRQQGIAIHSAWENVMTFDSEEQKYYSRHVTNQERVLAVLMLRSAILAGDSFTSEGV